MNDFRKRQEQFNREFDKDWKRAHRWFWVGSVASIVFGLLVTGFIAWVIIMVMRHFGVI